MLKWKVKKLEKDNVLFIKEELKLSYSYFEDSQTYLRQIFQRINENTLQSDIPQKVLEIKLLENIVMLFHESYDLILAGYSHQAYAVFRLAIEELTSIYVTRMGGMEYENFVSNELEVTKFISKFKEIVPQAGALLGHYTHFSIHLKWEILASNLRPSPQGQYLTKLPAYDEYSKFLAVGAIIDHLKLSHITCGIIGAIGADLCFIDPKTTDEFYETRIDKLVSIYQEMALSSLELARKHKQ